jgi:hypothetical protein
VSGSIRHQRGVEEGVQRQRFVETGQGAEECAALLELKK